MLFAFDHVGASVYDEVVGGEIGRHKQLNFVDLVLNDYP